MPFDFRATPQTAQMFGPSGIFAPFYARQAQQAQLAQTLQQQQFTEKQQRAEFDYQKGLAQFQQQLREASPYGQVQLRGAEAEADLATLEAARAGEMADVSAKFYEMIDRGDYDGAAALQQGYIARFHPQQYQFPGERGQQFRPPTPTFIGDPETGLPLTDEQGKPISVPGTYKFPPPKPKPVDVNAALQKTYTVATRRIGEGEPLPGGGFLRTSPLKEAAEAAGLGEAWHKGTGGSFVATVMREGRWSRSLENFYQELLKEKKVSPELSKVLSALEEIRRSYRSLGLVEQARPDTTSQSELKEILDFLK